MVTSRGGYDAVGEAKLAWRRVGNDFYLRNTDAAAYAFASKTTYFRNLVLISATHAKTYHSRWTELLEERGSGSGILRRTVENFQPPRSIMANGDSDTEGEEARMPTDEKMDIDEPEVGQWDVVQDLSCLRVQY